VDSVARNELFQEDREFLGGLSFREASAVDHEDDGAL
jgi:hypothetical protein